MSTATAKKLPNEPIVILTLSGNVADLASMDQVRTELLSILDAASEPVFFILDMSAAQLDFGELLRGASGVYRGDNPLFRHPSIRQTVQVSNDPTLELAAEGMDSEAFGNVKIQMFRTLEDALAYVRST